MNITCGRGARKVITLPPTVVASPPQGRAGASHIEAVLRTSLYALRQFSKDMAHIL
jgi:hypothetical protein